jgi:hypothetical protein
MSILIYLHATLSFSVRVVVMCVVKTVYMCNPRFSLPSLANVDNGHENLSCKNETFMAKTLSSITQVFVLMNIWYFSFVFSSHTM